MNELTYLQSLELIDLAVKENRVYHHNGGQAYIRLSMDSDVLMIINHSNHNKTNIELMDGSDYFTKYSTANHEHSSRLRDTAEKYGTFAQSYLKRTQLEMDMV